MLTNSVGGVRDLCLEGREPESAATLGARQGPPGTRPVRAPRTSPTAAMSTSRSSVCGMLSSSLAPAFVQCGQVAASRASRWVALALTPCLAPSHGFAAVPSRQRVKCRRSSVRRDFAAPFVMPGLDAPGTSVPPLRRRVLRRGCRALRSRHPCLLRPRRLHSLTQVPSAGPARTCERCGIVPLFAVCARAGVTVISRSILFPSGSCRAYRLACSTFPGIRRHGWRRHVGCPQKFERLF